MDKPYGKSKCSDSQIHQSGSACANTQILAPEPCCISPKHSLPHSIPVHLTDRAFFYKHPKYNPYTSTGVASKLSVQLKQHKYIYTSHMDFHVIQVNSGLLAGQVTSWLPNQETDPLVHHCRQMKSAGNGDWDCLGLYSVYSFVHLYLTNYFFKL